MALPPVSLHPVDGAVSLELLRGHLDALVERADVPVAFGPEVLEAADRAAASWREDGIERVDRTDVEFVTLDPASSTDLDQAMHLERGGDGRGGYTVLYAIADVPAFVALDGPIDAEARRRGQTVYLPDRRISLHPEALSEGAASLLPDQEAPAFVWRFTLDAQGVVTSTALERAVVRSRAQLAYDAVQSDLDAGRAHPMMTLLMEIGDRRRALEAERGGASLNLPEQEVIADGGSIRLQWRAPLPIEDANAQLSLMTGMAAAQVMIDGGAGILRTMPPADDASVRRLRAAARALGQPWGDDVPYGTFLRTLDPSVPRHLALLNQAASLFRGAGYLAFTGPEELPADETDRAQAAIGAPYAHTTAPLRRLVDRFVLLTCHHLLAGTALPAGLRAALPLIPEAMKETSGRAGTLEREALDLVEVLALAPLVGRELTGTVLETREATEDRPATSLLQFDEPPVSRLAEISGEVGAVVHVRLDGVDIDARTTRFSATGAPAAGRTADETADAS
ncbi:RNB domain-containing ribonuclease [Brachybacterium huguangmaarense]|uniref:RNB domain-containing ribonuclease n=1 Tax=Brachybacterium huguangmaarense TaxID=1652028 RepID=A0ABY6G111_9MICO|nr:RNB domain-containing ribonuclease [Brachybacterium huguangmaarense]UYG16336.1 RNB domain-containing ribonuclease [Brachybacterium huguangmaarense]